VMQNLPDINEKYDQRLKEKPRIGGKIEVKFAIDEFGRVVFCEILETTVKDPWLENKIVELIKNWHFENINKPGDVTEVIYPFMFSPNGAPSWIKFLLVGISLLVIFLVSMAQ
jgi:TonB family protein